MHRLALRHGFPNSRSFDFVIPSSTTFCESAPPVSQPNTSAKEISERRLSFQNVRRQGVAHGLSAVLRIFSPRRRPPTGPRQTVYSRRFCLCFSLCDPLVT